MNLFSDLFYFLKGKYSKKISHQYRFAFLVHARGYKDIYRKYPSLKWIPKTVVLFIMNNLWPITLSRVTGVYSKSENVHTDGFVLGITMTAEQMMSDRKKALRKIRQALYLARGKGVKIIGLGGLTSSLSGGGTMLLDIPINITTGHAYTAYNVTQNLFALTALFGVSADRLHVAIVGAAGSIGSMSVLLVARAGYKTLTLIDVDRKINALHDLEIEIRKLNPSINITISHSVKDISLCDFVITATNTPEALVTTDIVRSGMVIIDDAQPSDIHHDVLTLKDVLVIEAGVVETPEIKSNFNYGLKNRTDNFCCMAELLILARSQWENHYVIHRATLKHVDEIAEMGKEMGFKIASYQNFMESISHEKIMHMRGIIQKKYGTNT